MPTYHRSQRLRLVGTGPKVEQLQESRYRLTFTCTSTNPNEAWLNANKAQLFADYGTLQSAQMSISGISPRTDEAYPDMALTKVEANPSERDMIVTLVYETVDQDTFQKFQDDLLEVQDNGLRRITQYEIGKHTLSKTLTVGSTSITSGGVTCILSSKKEEVNDTFKLITTVYVESGILSTSKDNVGSQEAVVISKFEDTAPAVNDTIAGINLTGYSLAKQEEGSVEGAKTYNYTFLKNNVILSTSEDLIGSQKAVIIEKFGNTAPVITDNDVNGINLTDGYILANKQESSVDGIKTFRYTFLKPSILSRVDDKSDPARPITIVAFDKDESDNTLFGSENAEVDSDDYVLVSKTERDFEGIETFEMRFELREYFLQEKENEFGRVENVKVEQGASSYALQAMPGTSDTVNGTASSYIIAQEITEGIVPKRITTFSTSGVESVSEDLIGSTKVITITTFLFPPTTSTAASFSNDSTDAAANFVLISDTNNRVNGVDIYTYKFAKKNAIISTSEDIVGSQKSFVIEKFGDVEPANDDVTFDLSGHSVARKEVSDVQGIKTFRYTFLKNDVVLSRSRDNIGSQKAVVLEVFNGDNEDGDANSYGAGSNYVLAKEEESDVEGVKTRRYTYLEPSILSVQREKNDVAAPITVRTFNLASDDSSVSGSSGTPQVSTTTHILVSSTEEDFAGIKTNVFRFESNDYNTRERNEFGRIIIDRVEQSESSLSLQDQAAVYNVEGVYGLRILSQTTENNDNVVNRRLTKYTTVGIDEVREDIVGSQKAIVITKVGAEPTTTEAASYSDISYDGSSDWSIARKDNSRVAGLDVYTYTFLLNNTVLSVSEDKIGSQEAYVEEVFNPLVTIPGIAVSGGSSVVGDYFLSTSQTNGKNRYSTSDGSTYANVISWSGSEWRIQEFSSTYSTSSDINPNNADDPPETGWTPFASNANYEVENLLFRDFDDTLPTSLQSLSTSHRYEKSGYVLAKMDRSNVDGVPTVRYTFLRDNVILSNIIDESGVDKVVTIEKFNSDPTTSDANTLSAGTYTRLNLSSSNVDGIKTVRGVFLETGTPRVGSINPAMETEITEFQAYTATTFNDSLDNVGNTTFTLPDGGTLNTNAVVFEPTKDQAKKPTQFNQLVLDGDFSANLNHVSNTTPVLISQYKSLESFTYPGVVDITARYKSSTRLDVNVNMKETPTTALVNTTVYEFLQKGSDTVNSDFRYDGARGLWSPNEWGSFDLKVGGDVFTESRTYRGYRINRRSFFKLVSASGLTLASCKYQDQFVATGFTFLNVKMDIIQGPPDPVGKKWVLDVDISPFRRTVDGVQIYRKVIVVTDIIPSRVSNALSLS